MNVTKRTAEPENNTNSNANSSRPIVTAKRHPPAKKGMFSLTAVDRSVESVDNSMLNLSHNEDRNTRSESKRGGDEEEEKGSVASDESLKTADNDEEEEVNNKVILHFMQQN